MDKDNIQRIISNGLAEMNLQTGAAEKLVLYEELLLEKNKVMNLTAITDSEKAAKLHILDSAELLTLLNFQNLSVLDVGTGAGLPGVVLKLIEPSIKLTLLDSMGKRIHWLEEISSSLMIDDTEFIYGRAEDYGIKSEYRQHYDVVTSRAVAEMRILCELCIPFVKVGGKFLAMKSVECDEELAAAEHSIKALGGRLSSCTDYQIPGTDISHRIIIIEKCSPTKNIYPRRFSKIQKMPL